MGGEEEKETYKQNNVLLVTKISP